MVNFLKEVLVVKAMRISNHHKKRKTNDNTRGFIKLGHQANWQHHAIFRFSNATKWQSDDLRVWNIYLIFVQEYVWDLSISIKVFSQVFFNGSRVLKTPNVNTLSRWALSLLFQVQQPLVFFPFIVGRQQWGCKTIKVNVCMS